MSVALPDISMTFVDISSVELIDMSVTTVVMWVILVKVSGTLDALSTSVKLAVSVDRSVALNDMSVIMVDK